MELYIFTVRNEVAKVMFSHLSVSHSVTAGCTCFGGGTYSQGGGGVPAPGGTCLHTPRQVHPLAGTPPGRYTPQQVHPLASTFPRQVHPPGTPPSRYTPWQVHTPAGTPPQACTPPGRRLLLRTVRILLECILVSCVVEVNC